MLFSHTGCSKNFQHFPSFHLIQLNCIESIQAYPSRTSYFGLLTLRVKNICMISICKLKATRFIKSMQFRASTPKFSSFSFLRLTIQLCVMFQLSINSNMVTRVDNYRIFFSPGATTPIGGCILQPSSGLQPPRLRGFLITHSDAPQSVGLL